MYFVVAVIFLALGIIILISSTRLYASSLQRYDDLAQCAINDSTDRDNACCVGFNIPKKVTAPAYLYYGIVNFYQNARTYVSSRSAGQLRGDPNASTADCEPLETHSNGTKIVPCGLTANSQFNDSFQLFNNLDCSSDSNTGTVNLNGTGIAWPIDTEVRFKGFELDKVANDSDFEKYKEANEIIESEDFMVWMRLAPYRSWKKLYRIIEDDLSPGNYSVLINVSYPVESFGGEKFFFLSETSWFGGPNTPLAISYLVVGAVALVLAIFYLIRSRMASDIQLPPETSVFLDGIVKHPVKPQEEFVTSTV